MSISPHASPTKRYRIGTTSEPNRNHIGTKCPFHPTPATKKRTNRNQIGNKSDPPCAFHPTPATKNGTKSEPNRNPMSVSPHVSKKMIKKVCSAPNGLPFGFSGSHDGSLLGFKWVSQRGLGLQTGYTIGLRWASGDLVVQFRCRWVPQFVLVDPTGRFVWGLLSST